MCSGALEFWEPEITIGHFTTIGSPSTFMGAANHPSVENRELVANYPFNNVPYGMSREPKIDYPKCGGERKITIENDVWTGYDCIFRSGITIGNGAIIGMKSVVVKDIPPYAIAAGNPCRVRKYRFSQDIIDQLLKIKWWDWDDETIMNRIEDFKNVINFIKKYGDNN